METTALSPVQQTILEQVKAQFENSFSFYATIKMIVSVDENTLAFNLNKSAVQIRYNEGSDCYDTIKVNTRNFKQEKLDGLYCDQLGNLFI